MRPQLVNLALLLLLYCQMPFAAEQAAPPRPQLTRENIDKTTKVLREPGVIKEKIEQGINNVTSPASKNATSAAGSHVNKDELKDPTRMNQNFRDALERLSKNNARPAAVPGAGIAPQRPVLPKISLLASVCGVQKNTNSAILRINDKTQMVRAGDKITIIDNNQVVEIQILEIHKHHVKVTVFPANETLVL